MAERRWRRTPGPVRYVAPRVVALAATWLLATLAIFCTLYVFSDPVSRYGFLAGVPTPEAQRAALRHELGIDKSYPAQYGDWLADMARGDFGYDRYLQSDVRHQLRRRLEPSAELLIVGLVLGGAAGTLLALASRGHDRIHFGMASASVLASLPVFIVAVFVVLVPADKWGYTLPSPLRGHFWDQPAGHVQLFGIAGAVVAVPVAASVALALGRGPKPIRLPAALFAMVGAIPVAISAAIVVELIFTIPGLGSYLRVETMYAQLFGVRSVAAIVAFVALAAWIIPPRRKRMPAESVSARERSMHAGPTLPRSAIIALVAVAAVVVLAAVGPWMAPYHANAFLAEPNGGASAHHLLGTDRLGRDEFSRVLLAARGSLLIALPVVFAGLVPGIALGLLLVRRGRGFTLACVELASMGSGIPWLVALLVVMAAWPGRFEYVTGALAIGAFVWGLAVATEVDLSACRTSREVVRALAPTAIQRALAVAALAVLADATLSFLGLGQPEPAASFGREFQAAANQFPADYTLLIGIAAPLCLVLFVLHAAREVIRRA